MDTTRLDALLSAALNLADDLTNDEYAARLAPLRDAACCCIAQAEGTDTSELDTALKTFEKTAVERHKTRLLSPLYPFGFYPVLLNARDESVYRATTRDHQEPCDCRLLKNYKLLRRPNSTQLVRVTVFEDFYERYEEFRCGFCHTKWRHEDTSTEQISSWWWYSLAD